MKRPLKACVNHPDRPVQQPSWVLCAACLAGIGEKLKAIQAGLSARADKEGA